MDTLQGWTARLRTLVRRARAALAAAIALDVEIAPVGGPPAFWVEKVRAGAPHLLEPPSRRATAPVSWAPAEHQPAPPADAVLAWPPVRAAARTADGRGTAPAAVPPRRPIDAAIPAPAGPAARADAGLGPGPPRPRRLVASLAAVVRPTRRVTPRWPSSPRRQRPATAWPAGRERPEAAVALPAGPVARRAVDPVWPEAPAARADVEAVAPAPPAPARPDPPPAWPVLRRRSTVVELPPTEIRRWPDLPAADDDDDDGAAAAVARVDGLTRAERLRLEHEGTW